ncbi:hypothetical protein RSOLAG22IIIB_10204 [Rhizoctonia solani]|uniref:Uncharacterized protein n=1 Tax=Rhizoctonia solani TaxID=456999 RepID=A0A0K6G2Z9_9AGAM|nr:hypothetical protein RSOLAG22IIIB_10204 [Rhizoctonia solani]
MPHVDPPSTVMIEDENGVKQPWAVIPRPETIEKNASIRKLMELGDDDSDSDSISDGDTEDDGTAKAQTAIYRSIWQGIHHAMNAIVPGALHGKLKWKAITSAERSAIHAEVLENNPYLRRFPGGWISELIMQRQLRNARDTAARKAKQNRALKLKPLNHLSKKARAQTKKKVLASKTVPAPSTSKNQSTAPATSTETRGKSTATPSTSNSAPSGARQRTSKSADLNPPVHVAADSATRAREPLSNQELSTSMASGTKVQQKDLFAYFQPKSIPQSVSVSNNQAKTAPNNHNENTKSDSSDNEDESWNQDIDDELAKLKSKPTKATPASSSTTKKSRPKMRPPPAADTEGEEQEIFRRTTRAIEQPLDNSEDSSVTKRNNRKGANSKQNRGGKNTSGASKGGKRK